MAAVHLLDRRSRRRTRRLDMEGEEGKGKEVTTRTALNLAEGIRGWRMRARGQGWQVDISFVDRFGIRSPLHAVVLYG